LIASILQSGGVPEWLAENWIGFVVMLGMLGMITLFLVLARTSD
jgi:hypothetical protein